MDTTTANTASPQPVTPPTPPTKRTRNAGHVIAIVAGCLLLLPGLGMLLGGGAAAVGQAFITDDDGYFNFTVDRVESDGVAVAATEIFTDGNVNDDPGTWVLDWLDVDLRMRVDGAAATDEVFVGIGRSPDVEEYLAGVKYSEVVELDGFTPRYDQVFGSTIIADPADQDFWVTTATGVGEEELNWDVSGGRWSVVVMNTDGSPDVAADIELGFRSSAVTPIAIALLIAGALVTTASILLIVLGARGKKTPLDPTGTSGTAPTFEPPTPEMAAQLDDHSDQQEPTPVS